MFAADEADSKGKWAVLKKTRDGSDNFFLSLFRAGEGSREVERIRKKYRRMR